jgi:hypothetical protein
VLHVSPVSVPSLLSSREFTPVTERTFCANEVIVTLISDFRRDVGDICAFLGYDAAASCGNFLPAVKHHMTPCNILEKRRYHEVIVFFHRPIN